MSNSTKANSSLTPAKRQLLAMLRKQQGVEAEASLRIPRRSVEGPCALSFAQQRLWFLDQLEPGGYAYNMPVVVRISGDLNVELLERSLNEIIRRHETLRTSFTVARGVPAQAVAPDLSLTVELVDLRHLPESEGDEEVRCRSVAAARQPFDLGRAPLLRAQVLRLDEAEFVLLLTLHHIISDGWSMGVLIQEITTLYRAYSEGRVSPLPELAVQYADFALWQRERLQGQVLEDLLAY
ncbi:MAG TPA: condensation domain-containing protein, partial [Pyrinomonadaceae bacterium]|nr:condensation domain-containing protein [Pyrinomonadaceae bacterium]